ncbi:MAG: DivIVA domain-containing protein [Actinomycetota bacterium]
MVMTPREIQEKQFHDAFRGYSHEEVDLFIDQVAEDYGKIYRENQGFNERLRELQEQVGRGSAPARETAAPEAAPAPSPAPSPEPARSESEDMLKRMLVTAQETADRAIQGARAKAQRMVDEAEARAREIEEQADALSASTLQDAQRRAGELLKAATREEEELRNRLEGMRTFERDFRNRLGAYIRSQLELLEKTPVLSASAPSGLFDRPSFQSMFAQPLPRPAAPSLKERTAESSAAQSSETAESSTKKVHGPSPGAEAKPAKQEKKSASSKAEDDRSLDELSEGGQAREGDSDAEDADGKSIRELFWGED